MPETPLREKASKMIKIPDANPGQLSHPIGIKVETSDSVPTEEEGGASSSSSSPKSQGSNRGETLREKAAKKLHGPDANPTQLGDPISLKNETSPGVPVDSERGAEDGERAKRDPKL